MIRSRQMWGGLMHAGRIVQGRLGTVIITREIAVILRSWEVAAFFWRQEIKTETERESRAFIIE